MLTETASIETTAITEVLSSTFALSLADIISNFIAFLAMVVSLYAVWVSRRKVVTSAISAQRIEWVTAVRKLIYSFVQEYRHCGSDKDKLISIYSIIVLYCNPDSKDYVEFVNAMKQCISSSTYSDSLYWNVITEGQKVLDISWRRIKREAGITYAKETQNTVKYRKEKKKKNKENGGVRPVWTAKIEK